MAKLIQKKIQASTLVEVLVAMLLIMIVFAIASKIYLNTFMQVPSNTKLIVNQELEKQVWQFKSGESIPENDMTVDQITYHYERAPSGIDDLDFLEITATQQQQQVGKIKTLITKTANDEEN